MPVGDGRPNKSMKEQLRNGSILDQLRLAYPANAPLLPAPQEDPGRVRNRAFFDKMYGDCQSGRAAAALVRVIWLPKTWGHAVSITSVNGVDRQLAAVSRELDELPMEDKSYLYPVGGTYACRSVADTGRPSMHAWGAAIDINPAFSDYWRWHRPVGIVPCVREPHSFERRKHASNGMASSGVAAGSTSIQCTLNTDPNCCFRRSPTPPIGHSDVEQTASLSYLSEVP